MGMFSSLPVNCGTPGLDMALRKVLTVSKEAPLREELKEKRQREKRRTKKAHEGRNKIGA
jgi:hypothetical protein